MTTTNRTYTTRRQSILEAIAKKLKTIDGTGDFLTNVFDNVSPRLLFWDEVTDFPAIHLNAGQETRQYQAGKYKDRFLQVTLRCYVNEEDAQNALSALLEDVETVLEAEDPLTYYDKNGVSQKTVQTTIVSIDTDEGVMDPLGIGEIVLEVQY